MTPKTIIKNRLTKTISVEISNIVSESKKYFLNLCDLRVYMIRLRDYFTKPNIPQLGHGHRINRHNIKRPAEQMQTISHAANSFIMTWRAPPAGHTQTTCEINPNPKINPDCEQRQQRD
jgi:hypothetical protein